MTAKPGFLGNPDPVASWSSTTSAPKRLMSSQADFLRLTFHERIVRVLGVSVTPQIYEHGVTVLGNRLERLPAMSKAWAK